MATELRPIKMDNITSLSSLAHAYKETKAQRVCINLQMDNAGGFEPAQLEVSFTFYWVLGHGDIYKYNRAFSFEELQRLFVPGEHILDMVIQSAKIAITREIEVRKNEKK